MGPDMIPFAETVSLTSLLYLLGCRSLNSDEVWNLKPCGRCPGSDTICLTPIYAPSFICQTKLAKKAHPQPIRFLLGHRLVTSVTTPDGGLRIQRNKAQGELSDIFTGIFARKLPTGPANQIRRKPLGIPVKQPPNLQHKLLPQHVADYETPPGQHHNNKCVQRNTPTKGCVLLFKAPGTDKKITNAPGRGCATSKPRGTYSFCKLNCFQFLGCPQDTLRGFWPYRSWSLKPHAGWL